MKSCAIWDILIQFEQNNLSLRTAADIDENMATVNKRKKRRKKRLKAWAARFIFSILVIALIVLMVYAGKKVFGMLASAGNKDVDVTTITIAGGGAVDEVLVEPFDEAVYNGDELDKMVRESVQAYGSDMSFDEMKMEDGNVKLFFHFKKAETLSAYHGVVFNAGTIDHLQSLGVSLPQEAVASGGKNAVVLSGLMDISDPRISEVIEVRVPKKIRYASGGAVQDPEDKKKAAVNAASAGMAVIIY